MLAAFKRISAVSLHPVSWQWEGLKESVCFHAAAATCTHGGDVPLHLVRAAAAAAAAAAVMARLICA